MAGRLEGKIAVITGAASGIGFEVARGFAAEGARVFIGDLGAERSAAAAAKIAHGAVGLELDIGDGASIRQFVASVVSEAGGIDLLVNCAGVFGMQPFTELTESEFDRIFRVNTRGTLFFTQAVAKQMIAQGQGGSIVNVSSATGRRASPGAAIYSASKAAIISITQAAAQELIGHGIRVNAIAPGAVLTPMWDEVEQQFSKALGVPLGSAKTAQVAATPAGRMSRPDEYVGAAIFLASSESAYVVGQTLNVDGGLMLN